MAGLSSDYDESCIDDTEPVTYTYFDKAIVARLQPTKDEINRLVNRQVDAVNYSLGSTVTWKSYGNSIRISLPTKESGCSTSSSSKGSSA